MNKSLSLKIVYAILFLISIFFVAGSLSLGLGNLHEPGPGFMPFLAGVVLCALSVWALIQNPKIVPIGNSKIFKGHQVRKTFFVYASVIFYMITIKYIGYVISTFAFMLFLFKGIEPQKWSNAILYSILSTGLSYLIFVYLLKVQFI